MKAKRRGKNWLVGKIVAEGVDATILHKPCDGVAGNRERHADPSGAASRASHAAFYGRRARLKGPGAGTGESRDHCRGSDSNALPGAPPNPI